VFARGFRRHEFFSGVVTPNAGAEPRPEAVAKRRLLGVGFRVEPVVTHPAPPQTRT